MPRRHVIFAIGAAVLLAAITPATADDAEVITACRPVRLKSQWL